MKALIISNVQLWEIIHSDTFNLLKSIDNDVQGICLVMNQESDSHMRELERKFTELETKSSFINIKKSMKERIIIKNGVRYLSTLDDFDYIFYANSIEELARFKSVIDTYFSSPNHLKELPPQMFSNRYVHYHNIFNLSDFKLQASA